MKSRATLDQISAANGKPTTDQLRAKAVEELYNDMVEYKQSLPKYMNSQQRRTLRKVLKKQLTA